MEEKVLDAQRINNAIIRRECRNNIRSLLVFKEETRKKIDFLNKRKHVVDMMIHRLERLDLDMFEQIKEDNKESLKGAFI